MEWTNDQIIHLVNEYRNKPMLWDPGHDMYRTQSIKYEAWCDIAETFQCEITDLRKKINSIFASHRREKAKVRAGGRSNWFLYNHMSFLPSHVENDDSAEPSGKKTRSKRREIEEEEKETTEEEYDQEDDAPIHIIVKEETDVERTPQKTNQGKPRLRRVVKKRVAKDGERSQLLRRKVIKRAEYKKDECDTFGEYIASSLRKHDERTRSMIKQAINNILFEQEMKKYSGGGHYVLLSGIEDSNPLVIGDGGEK
ncbi:hypothetical protein KGM_213200 [Danaus plexippus plexippus]|uniref:MADF domain-containing protein n=1 Tax=Danaus plexippus plexippus TaxID=278856 RepID=A0A212FAX7_DANPL|nr:hypothetical protein KGM_213200 [Danaus plexippus plexippus]